MSFTGFEGIAPSIYCKFRESYLQINDLDFDSYDDHDVFEGIVSTWLLGRFAFKLTKS